MNRKLSDDVVVELTFLSMKELQEILEKLKDNFTGDRYDTIEFIGKYHTDSEILPLLPTPPPLIMQDKRPIPEKLAEIRSYYNIPESSSGVEVDHIVRSRGRKKSTNGTLKDRVFSVLTTNFGSQKIEYMDFSYENILKSGIVNISENTYKTILSQWRKEKGIAVKRGRKKHEN